MSIVILAIVPTGMVVLVIVLIDIVILTTGHIGDCAQYYCRIGILTMGRIGDAA